jgi:hypothetical protein
MRRLSNGRSKLVGVGAVVASLACSNGFEPAATLMDERGPAAAVSSSPVPPLPQGLGEGDVRLCKVVPADDPGGTFMFDVEVTRLQPAPGSPVNSTVSLTVVAGGRQCATVFTSAIGNSGVDKVVIVEQAPPANWALTSIDIVQYLYPNPNYASPRLDDSESVATRTATAYINNDMARDVTFTNDYTAPPLTGSWGCTPGYWKQKQHFDSWTGYATADGFNTTFGIGTNWFSNGYTLLDGLKDGGGGKSALARHAVAALLNAAQGFYPMTEAQVIAAVQAAYAAPSTIESTKNTLADHTEMGCPLN